MDETPTPILDVARPRREWPLDEAGYENAVWHPPLIAGLLASYPEAVYWEIGVLRGDCWRVVAPLAAEAHGVDVIDSEPDMGGFGRFWQMRSDEFFAAYDGSAPDVVFVDGDHHLPGCRNDVLSALDVLAPGGVLVIHDTLPRPITRWDLSGDGWMVREELEAAETVECFTVWRYPGLTFARRR